MKSLKSVIRHSVLHADLNPVCEHGRFRCCSLGDASLENRCHNPRLSVSRTAVPYPKLALASLWRQIRPPCSQTLLASETVHLARPSFAVNGITYSATQVRSTAYPHRRFRVATLANDKNATPVLSHLSTLVHLVPSIASFPTSLQGRRPCCQMVGHPTG